VEAWKVRDGAGALVLVVAPAKEHTPKQYKLRYYDLDSGRRRDLGDVPMAKASVKETEDKEELWAFALSGTDLKTNAPVVLVGDEQAVPGVIEGAVQPEFEGDSLGYQTASGEKHQAKVGVLLGTSLQEIYAPADGGGAAPQLLQVFPDESALEIAADGRALRGTWHTDGETLMLRCAAVPYSVKVTDLKVVKGVPAGEKFTVRLIDELSSAKTHKGATVRAFSIMPVVVDGEILIPAGSQIEGKVVQANSVGWGFKHETASLTVEWTKATLADGRELAMTARVFQVENAQETVKGNGQIKGIRSTGTPGYTAENGVLTFAGIDPVAYIFAESAGSGVLGFAEPEILYSAGTEVVLENERPLLTSQAYAPSVLPAAVSDGQKAQLQAFVKTLPYRTATKGSHKLSDLTNLVFIGPPEALDRAFIAAGWLPTDELTAGSTFKTIKTVSGNSTYTQAPMSVLLLDERPPELTLSKTTNTFASRHHIRIFPTTETRDGMTVLTASSTQDIGIAFSRKQKTFIHVIDEHIDNERSKVINDLVFTGCVSNLDMVDRPWVPRDAYNSTGDRLLTDGEAGVLVINDCKDPRTTPHTVAKPPERTERIVRDTSLTIRNGFYRGNVIYMGIAGGISAHNYFKNSSELPPDNGAWRKTDASGATEYKGKSGIIGSEEPERRSGELHRRQPGEAMPQPAPEDLAAIQKIRESHKWDPPKYEIAVEGGYEHMHPSYLSAVGIFEVSSDPSNPAYFIVLTDQVGDGWAGGGTVTVNSWRHFSNEFSYFRQQVKYELDTLNIVLADPSQDTTATDDDGELDADRIGLVTRQFEYNLLIQPTRPTSRIRPYLAVGPVLQLVALNDAPLKKPAGVFNLGLKNIGLIKAAFDFGTTPPLDGGGIFHLGLQYGAGVKYRVAPRMTMRADWRQTWAKNPNIIANSYEDYEDPTLDDTYTTIVTKVGPEKKFIKDRFTLGVAFTF
jgi:opacity protein-like surface antigen